MALAGVGSVHVDTISVSAHWFVTFALVYVFTPLAIVAWSISELTLAVVVARRVDTNSVRTANVWILVAVHDISAFSAVSDVSRMAFAVIPARNIEAVRVRVATVSISFALVDIGTLDSVSVEASLAVALVRTDVVVAFSIG